MEQVLRFEELRLTKKSVYTEMGYGNETPKEPVRLLVDELFNKAGTVVKPRFYFQVSEGQIDQDRIICNSLILHVNHTIATLLKNSEKFIFFAATAGMEYQEVHNELSKGDDALTLFVWDALGSCIAEATGDVMEKSVEAELPGMPHTNRFSPGYCGWHVSEQKILFSLLPSNVCGIQLNESALMYPIKSISGVMGAGLHVDTRKYGCQFCELDTCYKKRLKKRFDHETQTQP